MSDLREIKCSPSFYQAIVDHRVGILLVEDPKPTFALHEIVKLIEESVDAPTGRACYSEIIFMVSDPAQGLRFGFVALLVKVKILTDRIRV